MSGVTYENRDTFISVIAWLLILYGVSGAYSSLSQLIVTVWFYPAPSVSLILVTISAVGLFFAVAAFWCGLGVLRRQRPILRVLIFFLWLYIVWAVGFNTWNYIHHFFLSSRLDSQLPEVLESMERAARSRLAGAVVGSIRTILEGAVIIWLIGQLSSPLVRHEFEA